MDVKLLATHPSFSMGFDRVVNGANYLFGKSVFQSTVQKFVQILFLLSLRVLAGKPLSSVLSNLICLALKVTVHVGHDGSKYRN